MKTDRPSPTITTRTLALRTLTGARWSPRSRGAARWSCPWRRPRVCRARTGEPRSGAPARRPWITARRCSSLLLALLPHLALAQSPADLIHRGQKLFEAGKYQEAADTFAKTQGDLADFNRAAALLRADRPDEAQQILRRTLQSRDPAVAGNSAFNLGYSLFSQGRAAAEKEPAKALEHLRAAAAAYRAALDTNPADKDAARNLEITRRAIRQVEDRQREQQQKQQQEQEQQQEQQKKEKEQLSQDLSDAARQQQQAADKSEEARQQPDRQQQSQKLGESKQEQDEADQRTRDAQQRLEDSSQDSGQVKDLMDQARQSVSKAQEEQRAAQDKLKEQDAQGAQEHQEKAAEHLRDAAEKVDQARQQQASQQKAQEQQSKQQAQSQQQDQHQGPDQPQSAQAQKTPEKPKGDPLAAQLLDREERQRQQRQQYLRGLLGRPVPVEKDW